MEILIYSVCCGNEGDIKQLGGLNPAVVGHAVFESLYFFP